MDAILSWNAEGSHARRGGSQSGHGNERGRTIQLAKPCAFPIIRKYVLTNCVKRRQGPRLKIMLKFASSTAVTVASTILPTLAITVLVGTQELKHKIIYIGGFTALFATAFIVVKDAQTSIVQVFTATVACVRLDHCILSIC